MAGPERHWWEKANVVTNIILALVAVVGLPFIYLEYRDRQREAERQRVVEVGTPVAVDPQPVKPSGESKGPQNTAGEKATTVQPPPQPPPPDLRAQIVGRWSLTGEDDVPTYNAHMSWKMDYQFMPSGELAIPVSIVFSQTTPSGIKADVVCEGIRRGQWSYFDKRLTTNITNVLYLSIASATLGGERLTGAAAAQRGLRCPPPGFLQQGESTTESVIQVDDAALLTEATRPNGTKVRALYQRTQ
jgi:hypothetical protein